MALHGLSTSHGQCWPQLTSNLAFREIVPLQEETYGAFPAVQLHSNLLA